MVSFSKTIRFWGPSIFIHFLPVHDISPHRKSTSTRTLAINNSTRHTSCCVALLSSRPWPAGMVAGMPTQGAELGKLFGKKNTIVTLKTGWISIPWDPWDWYIYLHLPYKSTKCRNKFISPLRSLTNVVTAKEEAFAQPSYPTWV